MNNGAVAARVGTYVPDLTFHGDEVYNTCKLFCGTDGKLHWDCRSTEAFFHHFNGAEEICTGSIHFIDECDSRYIIFICLSPNSFGLRFNTADCAENRDCTVENPKGAFNFDSKIDVPRRINNINVVFFPVTGRRSGSNCNTAFLLLHHPVHGRGTVVHVTDSIDSTGII